MGEKLSDRDQLHLDYHIRVQEFCEAHGLYLYGSNGHNAGFTVYTDSKGGGRSEISHPLFEILTAAAAEIERLRAIVEKHEKPYLTADGAHKAVGEMAFRVVDESGLDGVRGFPIKTVHSLEYIRNHAYSTREAALAAALAAASGETGGGD